MERLWMQKLKDRRGQLGLVRAVAPQAARRLDSATARLRKPGAPPSFSEVARRTELLVSPWEALANLNVLITGVDQVAWLAEYERVDAEIQQRYSQTGALNAPNIWRVERDTGLLLYALVRRLQPDACLETGVANGHSSAVLLRALSVNSSKGHLTSVDVSDCVGGLVPEDGRDRWTLRRVRAERAAHDFQAIVEGLQRVDLFFHDSDHSYTGQLIELTTIWPRLSPGAFVVVDDVNESYAYFDFAEEIGQAPVCLVDKRKLTGLLRKPL